MLSFISHFNQISLGNIPSWVEKGLTIDLESYDAKFDTIVILESQFQENYIFVSRLNKHNRHWNIVSVITLTDALIWINWARNIASNYFSQQQPASNFTAASNVMVHPCELRHQ